jgi:hypothetical protein
VGGRANSALVTAAANFRNFATTDEAVYWIERGTYNPLAPLMLETSRVAVLWLVRSTR